MIVDAFNDIPDFSLQTNVTQGKDTLNIAAMNVGFGDTCFKSDDQGIWLGAEKFVNAPFSVDMDGNMVATSLDLTAYLSKDGTGQVLGGNIIINDGTNDIVLIGLYPT